MILDEVINKTESYKDFIEAPQFCKDPILENFHTSILLSLGVAPIMIDNIHHKLLNKININNIPLDSSIEILHRVNKLLSFKLPDFSLMKIEDILDLRKDSLFRKFREKLFDINSILINKEINGLDESKIESLFLNECLTENEKF